MSGRLVRQRLSRRISGRTLFAAVPDVDIKLDLNFIFQFIVTQITTSQIDVKYTTRRCRIRTTGYLCGSGRGARRADSDPGHSGQCPILLIAAMTWL